MSDNTDNTYDTLKAARETLRNASRTVDHIDAQKEARAQIDKEAPESLAQKVKDMVIAARRVGKITGAAHDLYEKVSPWVGPVLNPLAWTAGRLKDAFVWASFERENGHKKLDQDGDPVLSPRRLATVFAVATGLGLAGVVGLQSAYFHATQFSELVYVTGKQEIRPGDLYQFTGCTSLPCSTEADNGKYYQIEQSLYSPRLLYPEEDVFANIPHQLAACKIDGYGIYFKELKPLIRWTEMYQNVYNVSCRPLSPSEIQQTMQP